MIFRVTALLGLSLSVRGAEPAIKPLAYVIDFRGTWEDKTYHRVVHHMYQVLPNSLLVRQPPTTGQEVLRLRSYRDLQEYPFDCAQPAVCDDSRGLFIEKLRTVREDFEKSGVKATMEAIQDLLSSKPKVLENYRKGIWKRASEQRLHDAILPVDLEGKTWNLAPALAGLQPGEYLLGFCPLDKQGGTTDCGSSLRKFSYEWTPGHPMKFRICSRICGWDCCGNADGGYDPATATKDPFYEGKAEAPYVLPLVGFEVTAYGRFEGTTQDCGRRAKEE